MSCCSDKKSCCSQEAKPAFVSLPGVEGRSTHLFRSSILSGKVKLKTKFYPLRKNVDLTLAHDYIKGGTSWELRARGDINDYVEMESKFAGFDSTDLKFSFRHPRAANTLTEFSTLFDTKTRRVIPKLSVSHACAKCKLSGAMSIMPSECDETSRCIFTRSKCDVSAIVDYQKIRAGVKLVVPSISKPSDLVHYYAACYTEGPVTTTLSSNSLKDIKGSLIYEHNPAHSFGVQATYDVLSKAYKSHFAFSKEIKKNTMFTGRVSSDLSAQINIEHRIDENLSFSISNEFALDDFSKPSKMGLGLEIST